MKFVKDVLYVPQIAVRQEECRGLEHLDSESRALLLPTFHLELSGDTEAEVDEQLKTSLRHLCNAWASSERCFIQVSNLTYLTWPKLLDWVFKALRLRRIAAVPVVTSDMAEDAWLAIGEICDRDGLGAALRVGPSWIDKSGLVDDTLRSILWTVGLPVCNADLLIDLGEIRQADVDRWKQSVPETMKKAFQSSEWRSVSIIGSAFPKDGFPKDTCTFAPRLEWDVWTSLVRKRLPFTPNYGDWLAQSPATPKAGYRGVASVRYAADKAWLVVRGADLDTPLKQVCSRLFRHPAFDKSDRSWARQIIEQCARGEKAGSNAQFVAVRTCRHLTLVTQQLGGGHEF